MTEKTPTGIYFETKKKPFDIQIDNNKKEPKLSKNVRYTDKQNYRRYKTLTEPKLLSRIMVDDDSANVDIQDKIQKLLGFKVPPKKDERFGENEDVFTAPSAYIEPPNPRAARIEPRAEARPTFVEPDEEIVEPIIPAVGYKFAGDFGERISTGLVDGLSAINDVSKEDSRELLGEVEDDETKSNSSQLSESLSEMIDRFDSEMKSIIGDPEESSSKLTAEARKLQAAARRKQARDTYLKQKDASNKITDAYREYKSKSNKIPESTPSEVSGANTTVERIERTRGRPVGSYGQNRRHEIAVEAIKQKKARNVDTGSFKVDRALYTSTFGNEYMNSDPKKGFKLPP